MIIVLFEVSIKKLIQALALVNESAFYYNDYNIDWYNMSIENEDTAAKRVVRKNEKFNVPDQTEKEEAETHENAPVENLADNEEIKRRKQI